MPTSKQELVNDLTLVLFYLNSWAEGTRELPEGASFEARRAWKGADWDAIDALREAGLIDCTNKAKSVCLTRAGVERAAQLIDEMGFAGALEAAAANAGEAREAAGGAGSAAPSRTSTDAGTPETTPQEAVPAFTFRLTFRFDALTCWRDLRVPKSFTFEDLHTAIQACLSWLNYHLYDFKFTGKGERWQVSWPSFETGGNPLDDFWDFPGEARRTWADAAEMRLDEVFPKTRTALYSYDYGDGWEIDVKLTDSKTPLDAARPLCVGGEGDNPPEDVGAEWGFDEFLRVIADPADPEHDGMVAWGEGQTFEHFDLDSTNERLSRYDDWRVKGVYE